MKIFRPRPSGGDTEVPNNCQVVGIRFKRSLFCLVTKAWMLIEPELAMPRSSSLCGHKVPESGLGQRSSFQDEVGGIHPRSSFVTSSLVMAVKTRLNLKLTTDKTVFEVSDIKNKYLTVSALTHQGSFPQKDEPIHLAH